MKRLVVVTLIFLVFAPVVAAQNPDADAAANDALLKSLHDRMRGQQIPMQDRQSLATPRGRNLDVHEIAKKTKELNDTVHLVNIDVINMSKGVLAADLSEKLRKIEKLSKELRRSLE